MHPSSHTAHSHSAPSFSEGVPIPDTLTQYHTVGFSSEATHRLLCAKLDDRRRRRSTLARLAARTATAQVPYVLSS